MDPLQTFDNFKLDSLDDKWTQEVWQNEFVSFPEPPVDYSMLLGSEDMESHLREACRLVKQWLANNRTLDDQAAENDDDERKEASWQTITAMNINVRALLAVLGYLMKAGQAAGADEDTRQPCLLSASLYFTLLSIPGSSTFHVFHPNLYQRAIDTLKLSEHLAVAKKTRITDLESLYTNDEPDGLRKSEKVTLGKGLNSILYDLITMLKTFFMKYQLRSLEITIINLVELTKLETEVNHFQTHHKSHKDDSTTSLSYNAFVALQDLCEPRHGAVADTIRLVMRYLMPHLCPLYLDLPLKASHVVWDTITDFIKNLLETKGSAAELGLETLIQHLLIKCPDRSEPRQKQAGVVAKLINICEGEIFLKSIRNLTMFAFHNKIPYRIFAQEVIGKLLTEMMPSADESDERARARLILIGATLSRCVDSSSMVRGKAMSIVELIVNSDRWSIGDFLNTSEDDQPFPSVEVLLEALETDTNPLPGANVFHSMLLNRIKDERALVRRSAMHALQNLLTHFPALLEKVAPIIGQHCRDPALWVRKDAIHALAALLQCHPLDKRLLDEYAKSALPRIYDVETKVQDKVLESLQDLILNGIQSFSSRNSDETHNLPWIVINKLIEAKMKKNLSKACDSWVKSGVISNSIVVKIQSHIGTEHDTEAWLLLSVLAENTELKNMDAYFEDYETILKGNNFVTTLKLEVLRYTWQSMKRSYLEHLHQYIFERLRIFHVTLECIGTCMDIYHGITNRLHKSEEEVMELRAIELMRLSEQKIDRVTDEDEEVREETIGIYLKAMSTLGHASFFCSEKVSSTTLSVIQSLLLDCDGIKMSPRCAEKFKAAGIVVLGQQAMRDRDIAEQVMPIFGRLMSKSSTSESSTQAAIRINAVKALADLCIRFTALVDPYLPDMCVSMKDPNAIVREAIVVIFVQLLLEDYIKVKGAFFYHILTMLTDEDETIRELTIFLIKERLLVKNKTLIPQSFIRSVFHYNNCQTRNKFNDRKIRKKERDALTLPDRRNQEKRRAIYDFMIEHLDPPNKLKILTRLNSEVFEGVCEKFINVKQSEGACVLEDVIYIISNDRMSASYGSKVQEDEGQDETTAVEIQTNNAVNVIVEGMKKFKFTVMLQTVIKLRQFLCVSKSPLSTDVSRFLQKIISDFNKDQVAEIYEEYPELRKEIERDISMHADNSEASSGDSDADVEPSAAPTAAVDKRASSKENKSLSPPISDYSPIKRTPARKSGSSTPRRIQDVQLNEPKIVLRRLSTLTYTGLNNWLMSPPRDTSSMTRHSQSSDPGPSSSGISVSSGSPTEESSVSSPDLFEPEYISTPKPKKVARLSKRAVVDAEEEEDS